MIHARLCKLAKLYPLVGFQIKSENPVCWGSRHAVKTDAIIIIRIIAAPCEQDQTAIIIAHCRHPVKWPAGMSLHRAPGNTRRIGRIYISAPCKGGRDKFAPSIHQIGRASCRGRVEGWVAAVSGDDESS